MDGIAKPALDAVSAFPLIQAALGILILLGGLYIMTRGNRDSVVKPPELIPSWLMMGPLHDVMGAVHDMAEEARRTNDLLERIDQNVMACKVALELIRDESRLR